MALPVNISALIGHGFDPRLCPLRFVSSPACTILVAFIILSKYYYYRIYYNKVRLFGILKQIRNML